jgi:hypothetical protein
VSRKLSVSTPLAKKWHRISGCFIYARLPALSGSFDR